MKVHKLEVYVIDFDDLGADEARAVIEGNGDHSAHVVASETVDIGEWHDGHPLNARSKSALDFRHHFSSKKD